MRKGNELSPQPLHCAITLSDQFPPPHRIMMRKLRTLFYSSAGLLMDLVARDLLSPSICLSLSVVHHGVFLAVFFWTNVMAYDIWQAIATLTPNGSNHPTLRKDK